MTTRTSTKTLFVRTLFLSATAAMACFAPAAQSPSSAKEPAAQVPSEPGVPDAVRGEILRGEWDAAIAALGDLERSRPALADWWIYLRGTLELRAKRFDRAIAAFAQVEQREPASEWRDKARFAHADANRELGRLKEAEAIYEAEAKRLLSENRQVELAAIYLSIADRLSIAPTTPTPTAAPIDYERAVALYSKALELDAGAATRERALYRTIVCRAEEKKWNDVVAAADRYRAEFDPTVAGSKSIGEHVFDVRMRQADATRNGDAIGARRALEDLIAAIGDARDGKAPWSDWRKSASDAVLAQLESLAGDASFSIASSYDTSDRANAELAIAAYERFLAAHPNHPKTAQASFAIGFCDEHIDRDDDALAIYEALGARPDPAGADATALEALSSLRMQALFQKGLVLARQKKFDVAIATFTDYVARYSTGPHWAQAQQAIVDTEYRRGTVAREEHDFEHAREAWDAFLVRHPLDGRAPATQLDLAELYVDRATALRKSASTDGREAPKAQLDELFRSAIAQLRRVVAKYPGSNVASNALLRIGELEENEIGELEVAVEAYRQCNFGPSASEAAASLARMTVPSLEVTTERVWRSGETPKLKLALRNVEKLKVEIFALDLEAYFRKNLSHLSIESLDLDLIAANQTVERAIDGYAKYKPIEEKLELPVKGPGVWAIAITAGELRATTLVISSDLDVIVRSSASEALVFAEDMPSGKPAKGVRVLLGSRDKDGAPIVLELTTGDDGTASTKLDKLAAAAELSVLAARGGHVATNARISRAVAAAPKLTPRALIYTDRPVYRPGELVRWRAIVREVVDSRYAFEAGKSYDVEVQNAAGQDIWTGNLPLSAFGTLNGELALDDASPVGDYRVICTTASGAKQFGVFGVQQFQLPKVELTLTTPREVYFRGEKVEVTAHAAYYWGEPVANSPLVVALPDQRQLALTTDLDGNAKFEIETRDFASEQQLAYSATLTQEQVGASDRVYLAVREFSAYLSTPDATHLAGSSFDLKLATRGPDAKPLATKMKLSVLRRESSGDTWSESKVAEYDLATDAKDGVAHQSITIAKGGDYALRAHASDRFGNPIDAAILLFVSGEDDPQRLRFVVKSNQLKVGEKARLELLNRADGGLALVTIESDTILEHRIVPLAKGSNSIELAVDHTHFPNFTLAAAMMHANELCSDQVAFEVSRELSIKLEPDRAIYRPGDDATVKITVVDQLGSPVQAELSLSVIDEALFERFPDRTPSLQNVFDAASRRSGNFATSASCTFAYQGVTATIASAVLAEAERAKRAEKWEGERDKALKGLGYVASAEKKDEALAGPQSPGGPATPGPSKPDAGGADFFGGTDASGGVSIGTGAQGSFAGRRAGGGRGGGPTSGKRATTQIEAAAEAPAETAFWSPNVATDAKGEARVSFKLPKTSTRWRLTSRGVDRNTLVGQALATIVSKDEFFVELRTPLSLTEGDSPRFTARVHNLTGMTGKAKLVLRAEENGETKTFPLDVELGSASEVEAVFPALDATWVKRSIALSLEADAELNGVAREGTVAATIDARPYKPRASTATSLAVRPWGLEFAESKSGVLRGTASFELELDGSRSYGSRSLELTLGASVDRLLVSAALGEDEIVFRGPSDATATAANELLGVCATLDLVSKNAKRDVPDYANLMQRARSLVARLSTAQRDGGEWGFAASVPDAHVESSCAAMIALAAAKTRGVVVSQTVITRGTTYLLHAFRDASQQADETKALLSWALAVHQQSDFGALNRLHRQRASLSPAALAYTALALAETQRAPMAEEVALVLESKTAAFATVDRLPACSFSIDGNVAWSRSSLEMTALAALALERAKPKSEKLAQAIEFLLARRPWYDGRVRGLAVAAVATFRGTTEPEIDRMRVVAKLAGEAAKTIELSSAKPGETIRVELPPESSGRVKVELTLEGRGAPHFAAVLRGFSNDVKPTATHFAVAMHDYLAADPRYRGSPIETGFAVLQDASEQWINRVGELGFGAMTRCRLTINRFTNSAEDERRANDEYLVVEIPLPAGARLLENSWNSVVKHVEERDGSLILFLGQAPYGIYAEYTLIGAVPGAYRALPVIVRNAYEPENMAIGAPTNLVVLARGETSHDVYKPTPSELFNLGQAMYAAGEKEAGRVLLQQLVDGYEAKLREPTLAAAASTLLFANIERKSPRDIVRYFEILKEKNPDLYIPFDQVTAVGAAYREIEEFERASTIFRATIEETFGKELRVIAALEAEKEFDGATKTLARLCREYPDDASVVQTKLSLADKLLKLAPVAHTSPNLVKNGRDRAALTLEAILELQRFLALHSLDPQAPEAGLDLMTAHLSLDDYATASKLGGELADAYAEPRFADAFRYSRAVAEWYLGHDERAIELLEHIASAEYTAADGKKTPSPNRDLALYILGQIHHARQEFGKAAEYYERVQTLFADAREALASLHEKSISLPEVTNARPGEKTTLEIAHRNLKEAELLVYPVDLMTLYLREKNLSNITRVNLSGIAPTIRKTVSFDAKDGLQPAKTKVELSLADPGAYLVICRGDELHASGLALVSKLDLAVKEDATSGRLRIQVLDHDSQKFVRDVDVRVIGSQNQEFVSGRTDPRGLFAADGVSGSATVIARFGDRQYAFYRGSTALAIAGGQPKKGGNYRGPGDTVPPSYLQNVIDLNGQSQGERYKNLDEEIRKERKGVQIRQVK